MAQFRSWVEFEGAFLGISPKPAAKAALHVFSTFSSYICESRLPSLIAAATDEDLGKVFDDRSREMRPIVKTVYRCRLKQCLAYMVSDAQERWPVFWSGKRAARLNDKKITLDNTLPFEVTKLTDNDPLYVVFRFISRQMRRHTNRSTVLSLRIALSFVYGFLFAEPVPLIVNATQLSTEQILFHLKSKTKSDICEAYKRYREEGRCCNVISLQTLGNQLYIINTLFVKCLNAFSSPIETDSFGIFKRKRLVSDRSSEKSGATSSDASSGRFDMEALDVIERWDLSNKVRQNDQCGNGIHVFSCQEVRDLYLACETLFEKILLTFLFGTGMRIGGFCRLQCNTWDRCHPPREGEYLTTREKGGKMVNYRLSPVMAKLLTQWISTGGNTERYLFPHPKHTLLHIQSRFVRNTFMDIARRVGPLQPHVHPHTTRHTVIWTLWALGNPVEAISKFVHHSHTSTTMDRYIKPTDEDIHGSLNMPWAGPPKSKDDLRKTATALSLYLASPFHSSDGKMFPASMQDLYSHEIQTKSKIQQQLQCKKTVQFHDLVVPTDQVSVLSNEKAERKARKREMKAKRTEDTTKLYQHIMRTLQNR